MPASLCSMLLLDERHPCHRAWRGAGTTCPTPSSEGPSNRMGLLLLILKPTSGRLLGGHSLCLLCPVAVMSIIQSRRKGPLGSRDPYLQQTLTLSGSLPQLPGQLISPPTEVTASVFLHHPQISSHPFLSPNPSPQSCLLLPREPGSAINSVLHLLLPSPTNTPTFLLSFSSNRRWFFFP